MAARTLSGVVMVRILNPKGHAAGRRPVLLCEVIGVAVWLLIEDEVDVALAIQRDILGAVPGDGRKPQRLEYRFQDARLRRGELNKLKAVKAHRVFK